MSAPASTNSHGEDLARALDLLVRELCAGGTMLCADGRPFPQAEAVREAMAAARSGLDGEAHPHPDAQNVHGPDGGDGCSPRYLAYEALVRKFLRECAQAQPANLSGAARGQPRAAGSSAAAAKTGHPVPAAARTLDALRRLAPIERAALLLVAVERFSYAEAASMLEMDRAGLVAALARAREALAARLASRAAPGQRHLRLVK